MLLANVLHYQDDAANVALMRKVAAALAPGGAVLVVEQLEVSAPLATANVFMRLLALNYRVGLGGRLYSAADIARWCTDAALSPPRRATLHSAPGTSLLTATR